MSTTDEWSAKKILVCFLIFWGGFALVGCYYLSGWWGSSFLSYLFAVIFGWIGWVANLMWLGWCEKNLPENRAGVVGWSVILVNIFFIYYFGEKFGLMGT
jgi:hypothetical protein